jgi:hypothetical protein
MRTPFQPNVHPGLRVILILLLAALVLPERVRAECKEFKIVEYEDRVEAVCVGEPLTEAQKKANLEEEKRQEAETQRQRVEEQKRQREAAAAAAAAAAVKSRAEVEAAVEGERKRRNMLPNTVPQPPANKNSTTNPQILFK